MDVISGLVEQLAVAAGCDVSADDILESPIADYGSPIAFRLGTESARNPLEIASEIAAKIPLGGLVCRVEAVKGYVNFYLDRSAYSRAFIDDALSGKDFGGGSRSGNVLLEHTSVNPTGPVHVGRLRNTIIGDSLRRILSFAGYDVETHFYVNDIGKQIAIISLGRDEVGASEAILSEYPDYSGRKDYEMFAVYVPSFELFESDPGFRERVQELIKDAESGDKAALDRITGSAKDCLDGQLVMYGQLGVKFDSFDYESESVKDGSVFDVIGKAKSSELWRTEDFGGGLDLSGFGIEKKSGLSVLVRADGTTVYLARDLAYHLKKAGMIQGGGRIINVLGEDHKLEFAELKAILGNVLGFDTPLEAVHYSFVNFEGDKFSTRRGNIASVDQLMATAYDKAAKEVAARKMADESIAELIGTGAVKFHIIKTHPNKQITFRWDDALDFDGESGPYIQYAHARSRRILEKAGAFGSGDYAPEPENDEEWALIRMLSAFPEQIERAADGLRPDIIATYLIKLTQDYGRFYMRCNVLDSDDPVRVRRLIIVSLTRDVLARGLDLLGIGAPERM
ncbi:arginine--tRNA ligase [Candidatus Altiarchaeota archaeon]